ncbi:MAG: DUF5106 domain-containing protein [Bacteroidales bacterium]|nr:DUF5106 domain-containing protein [Bacteroidales bacterium]
MRKSVFIVLCLGAFLLLPTQASAQKKGKKEKVNYEISIYLEGVPDTMLYIGYYYADKTYSRDSVFVEKRKPGTFVFKGSDTLSRGVYIVAGQRKNKYLEFLVDTSRFFSIRATGLKPPFYDVLSHLSFENSPENDVFLDFQQQMVRYQSRVMDLGKSYKQEADKGEKANKEILSLLKSEQSLCLDSMHDYTGQMISRHPDHLFSKIQRMNIDISIPDKPEGADSAWEYRYYVNHYWDNTDLSEDGLLMSPLFFPKLKRYYEGIVPVSIDSIIKYTDLLVEKITSKELFKYVVWYVTHKYERGQYIGQDAVFVHMVKTYYEAGRCPWVEETQLEAMVERAHKLDPILIGKQAPQLWMMDTSRTLHSNYEFMKQFTIMWFWDVDCSHCKSATPKLAEMYKRLKDSLDIEVMAICMSADTVAWRRYLRNNDMPWVNVGGYVANIDFINVYDVHSTPFIYVLNRQKQIIVKKLPIEELETFLRRYAKGEVRY